jgi:hypothetical protein
MAPYTNPITKATYNVLQCYNCESDCTCEWEWGNQYEIDGTDDGSYWTSILTDNLLETSPSLDDPVIEKPRETSNATSVASKNDESEERDKVFDFFHKPQTIVSQARCVAKTCTQQRMVPYTNPITKATYNVLQCYNCETDCTCEWEWGNQYEIDATDDGSYWTSILTDNNPATSPSPVLA